MYNHKMLRGRLQVVSGAQKLPFTCYSWLDGLALHAAFQRASVVHFVRLALTTLHSGWSRRSNLFRLSIQDATAAAPAKDWPCTFPRSVSLVHFSAKSINATHGFDFPTVQGLPQPPPAFCGGVAAAAF